MFDWFFLCVDWQLTTFQYDQVVGPNERATFAYQFFCDYTLEPRDYGLVVSVYYSDQENYNYTTVFFNNTINVYEPATEFDMSTIFGSLLAFGVIGLFGFSGLGLNKDPKKKKRTTVETGFLTFKFSFQEQPLVPETTGTTMQLPNFSKKKKEQKEETKNRPLLTLILSF